MSKSIQLGLWVLLITWAFWLSGQEVRGEESATILNLEAALQLGLAQNPELRAARESLKVAESGRVKARLWLPSNPTLELDYSTDRYFSNEGEGEFRVGVSQEFEVAGQRGKRIEVSELDYRRASAQAEDLTRQVSGRIKQAFFRLSILQRKREVTQSLIELQRRLAEAAVQRLKAGDIPELDANLFLVEQGRAEAEGQLLESKLESARAELNALLGGGSFNAVEASSSRGVLRVATAEADSPLLSYGQKELEEMAFAQRGDWAAAGLEVAARRSEVSLRRRERVANPVFSMELSRERSLFDEVGGGIGRLADKDQLLSFRVSLPLPLVDRKQAEIARAQAEQSVAEANREALRVAVLRDVAMAYQRARRAREALGLYRQITPKLDENLELLRLAYHAGQIDVVALLTESSRFHQIRLSYLEAMGESLEAQVELEQAVGKEVLIGLAH